MTSSDRATPGTEPPLAPPTDDVLGGLPLLLDTAAVGEQLRRAGNEVEGGFPFYLKYKPRTSCIAAYEFRIPGTGERAIYYGKCFAPSQFPLARHKASHHRWTVPASGPSVLPWPEAGALLFAFPNDPRLDGLRILARPRKLSRLVSAHLPHLRSEGLGTDLIRYKPERRAVFRSGNGHDRPGRGRARDEFYWRVYGDGQGLEVFRRLTVLADALPRDGVRTPRPYAYDPARQILAMEALPGRPLDEGIVNDAAVSNVANAAGALARLHGLPGHGLVRRSAEEFLAAAREICETLAWLSEPAGAQACRILAALQRSAPDPRRATAFVHGDFHPGQVLVGDEGVSLLDFDRSHLGSPLADLGRFLAHLRLARLEGRIRDEGSLASALLHAYAERSGRFPPEELQWWTAVCLLLLALTPFRRLEPNWREKVQRILASSEELLC